MTYNVKREAIKITLEMSEVEFDIVMDIIGTLDMLLEDCREAYNKNYDFTISELFTLLREKTFHYDNEIVFTLTEEKKR